jgi:hypothetical protein
MLKECATTATTCTDERNWRPTVSTKKDSTTQKEFVKAATTPAMSRKRRNRKRIKAKTQRHRLRKTKMEILRFDLLYLYSASFRFILLIKMNMLYKLLLIY